MRWWPESKNWVPHNKLTPEKEMVCLHLKQGCSLFSWGRTRDTVRVDPAENSSSSSGSSMHLEDGKLGFKAPPEIEKSWQTQSLLTTHSGSVYMNFPGWDKGADFTLAMTAFQWVTLVQRYTEPCKNLTSSAVSHGSYQLSQNCAFLTFIMALRSLFGVNEN